MSRTPYCPNSLSPWPRILFGDGNPEASIAVSDSEIFPSNEQCSDWIPLPQGERKRGLGDVGPKIQALVRRKRTKRGSQVHGNSEPTKVLDYDEEVKQLLILRKLGLKQSEREGDGIEFPRLKNLNLLDESGRTHVEESRSQIIWEDKSSSTDAAEMHTAPPRAAKQDHNAEICWHMKTERLYGFLIPTEFSSCAIHPTPEEPEYILGLGISDLTFDSPSSERSLVERGSTHATGSTIGSSTLCESGRFRAEPSQSGETCDSLQLHLQKSIKLTLTEEDPFLYIGKYIHKHKQSFVPISRARGRINNSVSSECYCIGHFCRTYLSGKPSKHCHGCRLPRSQPEIRTAISRMRDLQMSSGVEIVTESKVRSLQEDLMLVDMYNVETEKRCERGVWWEGWLIVEDLRRQGIVGSRSHDLKESTAPNSAHVPANQRY